MTCTTQSASPTKQPSFLPSTQPVIPPSQAPFGLSDFGTIPTCCRIFANTPRGNVNLVQDQERSKNGQVYWKSEDSVTPAEVYWSDGMWGARWILAGLQDYGFWGFDV